MKEWSDTQLGGGGGELDIIVCALPAEGGAVCVCV